MVYWAKPIKIKTIASSNANLLFKKLTVDNILYYFDDIFTQDYATFILEKAFLCFIFVHL